jgi:PIN domain nuclease of toxin-antitoxin system
VLLDTSALLWWFGASRQLSQTCRDLIASEATTVIVSAVSAWEVCTKVRIGKLAGAHELCEDFSGFLARHEFEPLPISVEHARVAGRLGGDHKGSIRSPTRRPVADRANPAGDERPGIRRFWRADDVVTEYALESGSRR